jgi:two-component system NtrC family sensor kinase
MLRTINSKIILFMSSIAVLILGIFSYLVITHQNKQFTAEVFRGAGIVSDTVTRSTRYDMLMADREGVHRMIENIGEQPGVERVRIFNKQGKIVFSANKNEINNSADKNSAACSICHVGQATAPRQHISFSERTRIIRGKDHRTLAVITPIYNEPDCYNASCHAHPQEQRVLGVLDTWISLQDVDNKLKRNRVILIIFTLAAILCLSLISILFIYKLVIKRLKQLIHAAKKVDLENLDVILPVKTKDEIGFIALFFNGIIHDLKLANNEIQAWNIGLERKLKEHIEKLNKTREQLIQSEKMASMGVLASSVAHEINNPLQGIFTYIKLMQKIISGKDEKIDQKKLANFDNYLQLMGNEIERCGDMVKNLLVFSKQSKLEIREANTNDIIRDCLKLLENKIKIQNIEIDMQLQEDILNTYCDVKQIEQTLLAMIINSIEAMPGGGKIRISTRSLNNRQVEITIADTGQGISKENLKNIFDPFFSTKEEAKSTGLGLFVAYGIIREHKGTIEVESELGKGTVFHIKLPVSFPPS